MSATADDVKQRVIDYYLATTESSYLANWAGESLGFHFGIADDTTESLDQSFVNTNAYLAERAGIGRGTRVLDGGCGVGGSTIWLAKEKGARATGVTLVDRQVELARKFARERGVEHLADFEQRDMLATGFPAASFDVVWNLEAMCHVADLDAYLGHVAELLRDGGTFACIDLCVGKTRDPETEQQACDGWALAPLRFPHEVTETLARHDFEQIETEDLTPRMMLSAQALDAMASRSLLKLRAEQAFGGEAPPPLYEGHVRAALAFVKGMREGTASLALFLARRRARR